MHLIPSIYSFSIKQSVIKLCDVLRLTSDAPCTDKVSKFFKLSSKSRFLTFAGAKLDITDFLSSPFSSRVLSLVASELLLVFPKYLILYCHSSGKLKSMSFIRKNEIRAHFVTKTGFSTNFFAFFSILLSNWQPMYHVQGLYVQHTLSKKT